MWGYRKLQNQIEALQHEVHLLRQNRIGLETDHQNCHAKIDALAEALSYVVERPPGGVQKHLGYVVVKIGRKPSHATE